MKKKFSAFTFIILGLISFLICTIFGLVSKYIFSFESVDIVSSATTLFAGIVGLCLYTDWRDQYLVSSIEKQQSEINNLCDLLFENYISMIAFTVKNKNADINETSDANVTLFELMEHVQRVDNTTFKLRVAFNDYKFLLSDFGDISKNHDNQITKYVGFLITLHSFVDALGDVSNDNKIREIYRLHFDQVLSKDLNALWSSCKGEMQEFLISLLKK